MQAILTIIRKIELAIAVLAFGLMVVVAFFDVMLRETTGSGLDGAREAAVLLMILLVMSGFGLATASGRQLRPRFADPVLPVTWQPALRRFGDFLSALIFALLGVLALLFVTESIELREVTPVLRIPSWVIQLAFPLAFGQAMLRHLIYGIRPDLKPPDQIELATAAAKNREPHS